MLTVMDWDEDGKPDLIAGNAMENFDGLRWYRNIGNARDWVLSRQANINGDWKPDLIAASEGGWIYYYRRR